MKFEYKCLPFEMKAAEGDGSYFEGTVSAFWNIDSAGEIVDDAAFDTCLDAFLKDGFIGGLNHDWSAPIGRPTKAEKQSRGLFIAAQISDTAHGRDVKTLLKDGVIRKLSIGYQVKSSRMLKDAAAVQDYWRTKGYTPSIDDMERAEKGARVLTSLHLFEGSPVTVPANMMADITAVKHALSAEESERMAKTISTATLEELKTKSMYLGENIEAAMTMAALSRLNDALFYNVLYGTVLTDDDTPLADRLVTLSAAFDEFRDISLTTIRTLLSAAEEDAGESNDATDSAVSTAYATSAAQIASEVKALWRDPALLCGEGEAPAAKSFSDQSDAALAAATGLVSRAKALNLVRVKEGRVLSSAVRTRLATLKDALSESLTDIDALLTETEKPEKSGASALSGADGKALSLSLASEFLVLQAAQLEIA